MTDWQGRPIADMKPDELAAALALAVEKIKRLEEELQGWHEMVTVPTEKK